MRHVAVLKRPPHGQRLYWELDRRTAGRPTDSLPMRITIDALPLLFRSAGVKNYLYYWIRHLEREPRAEVTLFPFLGEAGSLDHRKALAGPVAAFLRLGLFFLMNRMPAASGLRPRETWPP